MPRQYWHNCLVSFGTWGGTRTPTPLRETDFKSVVSADSTTQVCCAGTCPWGKHTGTACADASSLMARGRTQQVAAGQAGLKSRAYGVSARSMMRPPLSADSRALRATSVERKASFGPKTWSDP